MKKIVCVFLSSVFLLGFLSLSGCANTWDGVGKDLEKMGKDMQD